MLSVSDYNPTMGLEVELYGINKSSARDLLQYFDAEAKNDGSLRDETYATKDGQCIVPMSAGSKRIAPSGTIVDRDRFGAEIITSPYRYSDMFSVGKLLSEYYGHIPTHPRSSIHVHVSIRNEPWTYVQNVISWFVHLEAPLYRIAGLGKKHRGQLAFEGVKQNYKYCRPLTDSIWMHDSANNSKLVRSIDVQSILNAHNASDMVKAWGRYDQLWRSRERYIAQRVHGLNICPMSYQGTLEWRIFNGVYRHIETILDVVYSIHRLAKIKKPDIAPMPLGGSYAFKPDDFKDITGVDVSNVWGRSWPEGCDPDPLVSHYNRIGNENYFDLSQRVARLVNNAGKPDIGDPTFSFYEE